MGLFNKRQRVCPLCSEVISSNDYDAGGHVAMHIEDAVRGDPSRLQLQCGCPDVAWPVTGDVDWMAAAVAHLKSAHGMR